VISTDTREVPSSHRPRRVRSPRRGRRVRAVAGRRTARSRDEAEPLHVAAFGQQFLRRRRDARLREVVVDEVLRHDQLPLPSATTGKPNCSPSGAPYCPELATATETQSPSPSCAQRDHGVDGGRGGRRGRRGAPGLDDGGPPLLHGRDEVALQPLVIGDGLGCGFAPIRALAKSGNWVAE